MTADKDGALMDVVEVAIAAPHTVRVIDTGKTKRNADAIVSMAVMRRGIENHFFATVPAGSHKDGDMLRAARTKGEG